MIHSSRQLKALIRNMSKGDSTQAQILIRNYVMERFLERISLSTYKENFILKGGMLVAVMVGIDARSTMDLDATIKNQVLSIENTEKMIREIIDVPIDDGVTFTIKGLAEIMDAAEYGGIRVSLEAMLETMRTPLKLDISAGDIITPSEVSYTVKLMFEERTISIMAYNLETVLAEKLETIITRGTANTRLRDFYDLYILQTDHSHGIGRDLFAKAFAATCEKRQTANIAHDGTLIISEIEASDIMQGLWKSYQQKFSYAQDISWDMVIESLKTLFQMTGIAG